MASFASSATTGGARKHAWTKKMQLQHKLKSYKLPTRDLFLWGVEILYNLDSFYMREGMRKKRIF